MLGNRLNKKISIYFLGMLSSKVFPFLLIPIYAFYVSTDVLGYYDFTYTVMGVVIPFFYVAIWEAVLRFILSENNEKAKRAAIATSACSSLFITFILIIGFVIYAILFEDSNGSIALVGLMFGSYALALIWQYYARALEENRVYVIAGVLGTIINFILVLLLICMMKLGLNGLLISYIIGQFSVFIFIERKINVRKNIRINYFKISILKQMLLFSAPLVLNLTSVWLMSAFGRLLITNTLGTEANGLFSFASKFSLIVSMIGSAVTMAIIEEAIIAAKTKGFDSSFTRTIETIFQIFQSIALIAVPLIVIFYACIQTTDYYSSLQFAPWLLIYAVSTTLASNIGSVFQAIDKTKYQFTTTVTGSMVTVLISYILISKIGINAVIIGQILGGITMLLARYMLINKFVDFKINWKPIIIMTGLFLVITVVCLNSHFLISLLILPLVIAFICYINWNFVKEGYWFAKRRLSKYKK